MIIDKQIWVPYCGAAPSPGEWLTRWNLDPALLFFLLLLCAAYLRLVPEVRAAQRRWFGAGFGLLLLLFVSPFCALTSALFSARVTHHVLVAAVVAPIFVASLPRLARLPGSLAGWTGVHALIFWAWHSPQLYAWALSSNPAYWLMQLSLLASAAGFWAAIRRAPAPAAAAALLVTTVLMGLLGALITFAGSPLYAAHFASTLAWGYTPLEDQQLAGLIMWAPAAGFYLAAALALIGRWFAQEARLSSAT